MKRRGFLFGIGTLPLVVAAPSLAFQKVLPKDIPIPRTAKELGESIDKLFVRSYRRPYPVDSIKTYEDIGGKRYEHITYQLGSPALGMEEKIVHSLWITACMQREKCISNEPMILWRRRPVYQEDKFGDSTAIKSKVTARYSILDLLI